ncbi:hypothetical protein EcWSU1_02648 [Enterobacter ludwigii]|uniref:Uncharacterized protein n=1 Tax=Enterobacter ludwigii TaxID=299767 RepID=G8LF98_9ENTR|nr:hypothetical protein EcWSU1_02648 [Enterobacter ludwigii]
MVLNEKNPRFGVDFFIPGLKHIFQEFCFHAGFKGNDFNSRKL